jgi:hypothetical protein
MGVLSCCELKIGITPAITTPPVASFFVLHFVLLEAVAILISYGFCKRLVVPV